MTLFWGTICATRVILCAFVHVLAESMATRLHETPAPRCCEELLCKAMRTELPAPRICSCASAMSTFQRAAGVSHCNLTSPCGCMMPAPDIQSRIHAPLHHTFECMQAPAADAHVHMPVYAHWFRMTSIHEIERNANVEFFNGRSSLKTPEKYVEYRNFMVARYRKCPQARLTFLQCRQHLVGDVNAIRRVWTFLDSWGLINFEADPVPVCLPVLVDCVSTCKVSGRVPSSY
jgi:hypothetical protein